MAPSLKNISDENIIEAICVGQIKAKEALEELGMADLLKENKQWDTISSLDSDAQDSDSEDDCDDECTVMDEFVIKSLVSEVCTEDSSDISANIKTVMV